MKQSNRNTTALVTGASSGLGYELAKLLAKDGYNLVLVARSKDKLEQVAAEFKRDYQTHSTVVIADLSVASGPELVFAATQSAGINVEVLVNNAGFAQFGSYVETDLQEELRQIQVNVTSLSHLTKLYVRSMVERRSGRILNMASVSAFMSGPLLTVYHATKAYVLSYSIALSNELKDTGVTVTCVCPGATTTEFHNRAGMEKSNVMKTTFMDAQTVAKMGYNAMLKGKPVIITGALNWLSAQLPRFAPRTWIAAIAKKIIEQRKS